MTPPVNPWLSALALAVGFALIIYYAVVPLAVWLIRRMDERRENAGTEEGRYDP